MAKIRFRLNKGLIEEELKELKDKGQSTGLHLEKEYPIYIRYRSGSVDFSASIDFNIVSKNWDFEKEKAIELKYGATTKERIKDRFKSAYNQLVRIDSSVMESNITHYKIITTHYGLVG